MLSLIFIDFMNTDRKNVIQFGTQKNVSNNIFSIFAIPNSQVLLKSVFSETWKKLKIKRQLFFYICEHKYEYEVRMSHAPIFKLMLIFFHRNYQFLSLKKTRKYSSPDLPCTERIRFHWKYIKSYTKKN